MSTFMDVMVAPLRPDDHCALPPVSGDHTTAVPDGFIGWAADGRRRMGGSADNPFLIAGGGIGGLAAAHALALKGFPVRVLEQAGEFREIGAGIQLGPNV